MIEILISVWILAKILAYYWWVYVPILLFFTLKSLWVFYLEGLYEKKNKKVLLEIRISREIRRSPKAMEQFLANIYNTKSGRGLLEKYWKGKMVLKFSLEAASLGGEVHLYIRTPEKFKNIIEANIYAQYPDVEIAEAEDYTNEMPDTVNELYNKGYDMWGTEIILGRPDAYPIRTYFQFESPDEDKALDPISVLLEILAKSQAEERVWIQILIIPANPDWKDAAKDIIKKIREEAKAAPTHTMNVATFETLTPGQREVMEAVERNVAQVGFYTTIRYLYFAPKDIFRIDLPKKGIIGAFNQYGTQNLNYFKNNGRKDTDEFMYLFHRTRLEARKRKLLSDYKTRNMKESTFMGELITSNPFHLAYTTKVFVLSVEELATIYHLPTYSVLTASIMQRVESRKIGPPSGLSIFGEE